MYSDIEKRLRQKLNGMKQRCYGKNLDPSVAKHYRDKGIKVCSEWLNDPDSFVKWSLENGYKVGLSIDRINPDGDYEPSNCQWLTVSENSKKAAEDTRERRAKEQKMREEIDKFREDVWRAGSFEKYLWLEMYDDLTSADRASINFAVSLLKVMRESGRKADMCDAFACSAELSARYEAKAKNITDAREEIDLAFQCASEFIKSLIQEGRQQ